MSGSLLRHLGKLTQATIEISKGQFDLTLNIKSKDEFASLGKSFENMSKEIKRLLVETQEKARMESELKTAQMVQNTLFPPGKFKTDNLEVEGVHRSASECGGDWWFYFKHATGFYGIIADATGHGAGAALITAAAKSAINLMKVQKDLNLLKLTQALNHALYETAYGEILMTGFIFHFDLNGNLFAINASHEPPVVINNSELVFYY